MRERACRIAGLADAVRRDVIAATVLFIAVSPWGGDSARGDAVLSATFCLRIENRECAAPVAHGSRVRLRDLPRDADGRRIIYFHSVTQVEDARFLLHSMARGSRGASGTVRLLGDGGRDAPEDVRELGRTFRLDGRGDVANFVISVGRSYRRFRIATPRHVHSYGPLAAMVIDPEGNAVPGAEMAEIEIVP